MKMPDAQHLLGEADSLVRDLGFHASRGRPSLTKRDKCVVPYLAKKYGVSTRWISSKLREARRQKKANPHVRSVSYQAGLAAAFAGVRSLAPDAVAPSVKSTQSAQVLPASEVLKGALIGFLKNPGKCSRLAIDLGKALLDEIPPTQRSHS